MTRKCKSRMANQVIKFWTANPDASFGEFSAYLKVIWNRGGPTPNSLQSTLPKSGLLKISGSKKISSFTGGTHEVKTWVLRDKYVMDREV
jgi:hypothetical protein